MRPVPVLIAHSFRLNLKGSEQQDLRAHPDLLPQSLLLRQRSQGFLCVQVTRLL